jgi:hypothetical protein
MLNGSVQLGQLWAANPDLKQVPIPPTAGSWPEALEVPIGMQQLLVLPHQSMPNQEQQPVSTGGFVEFMIDVPGTTGDEVARNLQSYPTLRNAFGTKENPSGPKRADAGD